MGTEILKWGCDCVATPLADSNAIVLDALTKTEPGQLKAFTLDISVLSLGGLETLQRALQRTAIERLQIQCGPIKSELREGVSRLLLFVPWPRVTSLVLTGNNIDEWIQLWRGSESPEAMQLRSLVVSGTGMVSQQLSRSSALHLHQVIYSSPSVEVHMEHIELQEQRDWRLLVGDE